MEYIPWILAIVVIVAIYVVVKKSNEKKNCGRIACEPIVPVKERDEEGVGEDERTVADDFVAAKDEKSCETKE